MRKPALTRRKVRALTQLLADVESIAPNRYPPRVRRANLFCPLDPAERARCREAIKFLRDLAAWHEQRTTKQNRKAAS